MNGGICVLVIGMAFICYNFGMMNIRWNNYRLTKNNIFMIALAHMLYTAYQFIAVFSQDSRANFFGISAIFLCANCSFMILLVYINSGIKTSSMREFLEKLKPG